MKRKHNIVLGWIFFVIVFNVFYLFYKCFMRTVTQLVNNDSGDPDAFDELHKYLFVIFSIADIFNGLSVLYCFHSMASLARKQRLTQSQQNMVSTGQSNNMRDSLNEILLNRMIKKNRASHIKKRVYSGVGASRKNALTTGRMLPPDKQRRVMHQNNKKLFKMIEKNEEESGKVTSDQRDSSDMSTEEKLTGNEDISFKNNPIFQHTSANFRASKRASINQD